MHHVFRNCNDAFKSLIQGLKWGTIHNVKTQTRNGPAYTINEPVILEYTNPRERVLWNAARHANPFFHFMHGLWILAGWDDIRPIAWFNSRYAQYSDDGIHQHSAYGKRLRRHRDIQVVHPECLSPTGITTKAPMVAQITDQLNDAIALLSRDPLSRRVVLSMWDSNDLHAQIGNPSMKDVACNTEIMLLCRPCLSVKTSNHWQGEGHAVAITGGPQKAYSLDITVINRSNDILWGALGDNYVHFSMLQEYIVDCLNSAHTLQSSICDKCHYNPCRCQDDGSRPQFFCGKYFQVSNNLHAYEDTVDFGVLMRDETPDYYKGSVDRSIDCVELTTQAVSIPSFPLVTNKTNFDDEVQLLMKWISVMVEEGHKIAPPLFQEPYLNGIAMPMVFAWYCHKDRKYDKAAHFTDLIQAPDWRLACSKWLDRTMTNWTSSSRTGTHAAPSP